MMGAAMESHIRLKAARMKRFKTTKEYERFLAIDKTPITSRRLNRLEKGAMPKKREFAIFYKTLGLAPNDLLLDDCVSKVDAIKQVIDLDYGRLKLLVKWLNRP